MVSKKKLYENIMRDISKVVSQFLIENHNLTAADILSKWSQTHDFEEYTVYCDWCTVWQDIRNLILMWQDEFEIDATEIIKILLEPDCADTIEWIADVCSMGTYENPVPTRSGEITTKYVIKELKSLLKEYF